MIDKTYALFFEFRNPNIQNEKIVELLAQATKTEKNIANIKRHDQNLILFSCISENENLFKFLSENFNNEFKDDFLKCVKIIYPNKNPEILKTSFNYLPKQDKKEIESLYLMFSHNCYRQENIEIVQNWLSSNLDNEEKIKFIEALFKNNNRPFLLHIASISSWKNLLQLFNNEKQLVEPVFLKILLSTEIKKEQTNINTSFSISSKVELKNNNNETPLSIKRKKRVKISI